MPLVFSGDPDPVQYNSTSYEHIFMNFLSVSCFCVDFGGDLDLDFCLKDSLARQGSTNVASVLEGKVILMCEYFHCISDLPWLRYALSRCFELLSLSLSLSFVLLLLLL